MLAFALIPLAVLLTALAGLGLSAVGGVDPEIRAMLTAASICLIGSLLAVIPLVLARGATQYAVAQAGLIATMVHLFVAAGGAGAMVMTGGGLTMPLVYWLLAFYWMTLAALVVACVRAVRQARITSPLQPDAARQ